MQETREMQESQGDSQGWQMSLMLYVPSGHEVKQVDFHRKRPGWHDMHPIFVPLSQAKQVAWHSIWGKDIALTIADPSKRIVPRWAWIQARAFEHDFSEVFALNASVDSSTVARLAIRMTCYFWLMYNNTLTNGVVLVTSFDRAAILDAQIRIIFNIVSDRDIASIALARNRTKAI